MGVPSVTPADALWRLDRARELIREWMPAGKATETLALLDAALREADLARILLEHIAANPDSHFHARWGKEKARAFLYGAAEKAAKR